MRRLAALAVFLLAACGSGRGELDIAEIVPARSGAQASSADAILYDVEVRAGQLRSLLDARGVFDLQVVDCNAPDAGGETVPITFGGEPLDGLRASQISDDPEMGVLLNSEIPGRAAALPNRCARLTGRSGFELASRPIPLPRP